MSQGEQEAPRPRHEGHSPELRAPRVRCVLAVWRDEATLACRRERDAEPWASVSVGLGHLHGRAVSLGGWAQLAVLAPEAVVTVTHTLLHQDERSPLAPLVGSVRVASGQCLSRPLFTACPRKKTFTWPPTQFLQNPAPSPAVRGAPWPFPSLLSLGRLLGPALTAQLTPGGATPGRAPGGRGAAGRACIGLDAQEPLGTAPAAAGCGVSSLALLMLFLVRLFSNAGHTAGCERISLPLHFAFPPLLLSPALCSSI